MRNRFPGSCIKCLMYVPAGEGHPQKAKARTGLKWHVKCVKCVEADRVASLEVLKVQIPEEGQILTEVDRLRSAFFSRHAGDLLGPLSEVQKRHPQRYSEDWKDFVMDVMCAMEMNDAGLLMDEGQDGQEHI